MRSFGLGLMSALYRNIAIVLLIVRKSRKISYLLFNGSIFYGAASTFLRYYEVRTATLKFHEDLQISYYELNNFLIKTFN